jgi:formiminoglutamase
VRRWEDLFCRPDDVRLGEVVAFWDGDPAALRPGRPVLVGFPQEEGIRRNRGRPGAAAAPHEIRQRLYRLTPWDAESGIDLTTQPLLDAGNVRIQGSLEDTQQALAEVVAGLLEREAVPIVLGGGHETAYGNFLGYALARRPVGIINVDAHLDVRPCVNGLGHSGSPFRQALEHPSSPLPGPHYVCLGAQPHAVSRDHWQYARDRGCVVRWWGEVSVAPDGCFLQELERLAAAGCQVHVSLDADAVQAADVPGVSAPAPLGLAGQDVIFLARLAGRSAAVTSLDLVEISPPYDRDGQSARWAALVLWHFLVGLAERTGSQQAVP